MSEVLSLYAEQSAVDFSSLRLLPAAKNPSQLHNTEVTGNFSGPLITPELRGIRIATGMFKEAKKALLQLPDYAAFKKMTENEWRTMDSETYDRYEAMVRDLNEETRSYRVDLAGDTYCENNEFEPEYVGAVGHIRTMQRLTEEMWDQGLSDLYPEGSTVHYAKAQVINHDLERFFGINGTYFGRFQKNGLPETKLPLTFNERPSEVYLKNAFPGLPLDDLHDMNDTTIRERMVDAKSQQNEPIKDIMKVMDVFGKPRFRDPDTFFTAPDGYQGWVDFETNKGSLPFTIATETTPTYTERVNGASGKMNVSAESYAAVDMGLVLDGLTYIQTHFKPDFNFRTTLMDVCAEVSGIPDETLVKEFGRAHDLRKVYNSL